MAKAPTSDSIMAPDRMKPLLALSKRDPVQVAICLSAEGDGLMLLDKKAKPKKVAALLRAAAGKAGVKLNTATLRFGRAEVDTDYDAGMVRLFINKEAPGNMRIKLVEVVKRIPYQKVELNVDESLELESEEDEAEGAAPGEAMAEPAASAPSPPAAPPGAPDPALAALRADLGRLIPEIAKAPAEAAQAMKLQAGAVNAALKAGDAAAASEAMGRLKALFTSAAGAPPPPPPPGGDDLQKQLAGLIGRIAAAAGDDAARRAALARLAGEANAALKAGDPGTAAARIGELRVALDGGAQTSAAVDPAVWRAARQAWQDANDAVDDQINALRGALRDYAKGGDEEGMDGLAEALGVIADGGLNTITENHRVKLMAAVMDLGGGEAAAMQKSGAKAIGLMNEFKSFLETSEKIEVCDLNPFEVPMSIRATLVPPLAQMIAAVQAALPRA